MNNEYIKEILNNITGIYQEEGYYLILYKNKPLYYVDFDNFDWIKTDKIKTRKQEQNIIKKIVKEELQCINEYEFNTNGSLKNLLNILQNGSEEK